MTHAESAMIFRTVVDFRDFQIQPHLYTHEKAESPGR